MNENKNIYVPKLLAIIGFSIVMICIIGSIGADFSIFFENIVTIIFGLYLAAVVFLICLILMIISFFVVVGFYLIQEFGFWPARVTHYFLNQVFGELKITDLQIQSFRIANIIILVLVICALTLAIISLIMHKQEKEKNNQKSKRVVKPFNIITIILSSIGLIICVSLILLIGII